MDASKKFYERLGFTNTMQSDFLHEGKKGICIMMKNESILIELYQMPATQLEEIRRRNDGHVDHIAFDVDDIDTCFCRVKKLWIQYH